MNRDALVVGINQYPFLKDTSSSKAKHLKTPANDAEEIAQRLEEYGGFRVRRLPETIQEGQRRVAGAGALVQADLENAIIQLFKPVGESVPQTALLYFIGHGLRKNLGGVTEGFLATSDADPRKNQWGVSLRWLRELLQKSPVQQQIVWLDCCYSGELFNFAEADIGTAERERTRFFIAAAREFEPAEEDIEGQHGVFSLALWEGLDPRRQPEGVVNNDKLIEYIAQTLKDVPQQPIWYNPNPEIILTGEREQVFIPTPDGNCPYKGLRFFDVEDAGSFYGREALTQKLIERVQVGKGNFLAVLGVSGSGKSSLLRAGLMYQLQQERRLPGTEQWKIRIFTPGEQPLVSLATVFLDEEVTDIERAGQLKEAEDAIAQGAMGLARLIRASKSPRTVLIVDQFEEVFTVRQSQTERQQFIGGLLGALKQTGDKLCLIFAMRDDFLGKCAAYRELADLIQANLVMVTPMNTQELRQAIVEPAKKLGRKVEENLISAILKDLGVEVEQQTREPEPGMLPLLSYTLEQLWQRQVLNWLKLDSYIQLGGVQKTLENLAERAYKELSFEEQRVADQIFINLTQLGEGTPHTRKQVPQQDLVTQAQLADLVERVIQKLAQAKLIVTSEQRKGQEKVAVVDVAHEALIRYWSRLRELLDNNREAIRTERKIQAAAEEWRDKGKSKDYLLTGLRLGEAEEFLKDEADIVPPSSLAHEFVQKSIKHRRNNRFRLAGTLTGVIVSLLGLTSWAFIENENSQIRELTVSSEALFNSGRSLDALMESLKAAKRLKQPLGAIVGKTDTRLRVIANLNQAVYGAREYNRFVSDEEFNLSGEVSFSPDLQKIALANGNVIKIWSQNGKLLKTLTGHRDPITNLSFSPDGQILASASSDGAIKIWNDEGLLKTLTGHSDRINSLTFSPNSQILASTSLDGTVKIWIKEGQLLQTFQHGSGGVKVRFSSDSNTIFTASFDNKEMKQWSRSGRLLKNWKLDNLSSSDFIFNVSPDSQTIVTGDGRNISFWSQGGSLLKTLNVEVGNNLITEISFSPDGKLIALAIRSPWDGGAAQIQLWSSEGILLKTFEAHDDSISEMSFCPDGRIIISASTDGTIKLWTRDGTLLATLKGHGTGVSSVSFSSNGQTLVSSGSDGTVRFWSRDSMSLKIFKGRGWEKVSFSSDGQTIASAGSDLKLWSLDGILLNILNADYSLDEVLIKPDGQIVAGVRKGSVSFSPDGQTLVSNGNVELWNLDGALLKTLQQDEEQQEAEKNNTVTFWSLEGKKLKSWEIPGDDLSNVSFTQGGQIVASAHKDGTIKLWSRDGIKLKSWAISDGYATNLSISQDGQMIASKNINGALQLWRRDGKLLKNLQSNNGVNSLGSNSLSISRNKQMIAETGGRTIKLWSADGTLLRTFQHNAAVKSVSFSPDGKTLASGSFDRTDDAGSDPDRYSTVILWNLDLDDLMVRGCGWVRNYLNNPKANLSQEDRHLCEQVKPASPLLIDRGRELAQTGNVEEAIAKFKQALEIDSSLDFDPERKAKQFAVQSLLDQASKKIYEDDNDAVAKLKKALELNPSLNLYPSAKKVRDSLTLQLVRTTATLLEEGEVKKAMDKFAEVKQIDPTLEAYKKTVEKNDVESLLKICWYGNLKGHASHVENACKKWLDLKTAK